MRPQEEILYWVEIARDDLRVARNLLISGDRLHALFFCHLSIEKMLKALFVKVNRTSPPPIHHLPRLAMESGMELSEEDFEFLNELLRFNIEARYPKDRTAIRRRCTVKYVEEMFVKVKKWQKRLSADIRK